MVGILSRSGRFSEQGSEQNYSCAEVGKTKKPIVSDKNGRQAVRGMRDMVAEMKVL